MNIEVSASKNVLRVDEPEARGKPLVYALFTDGQGNEYTLTPSPTLQGMVTYSDITLTTLTASLVGVSGLPTTWSAGQQYRFSETVVNIANVDADITGVNVFFKVGSDFTDPTVFSYTIDILPGQTTLNLQGFSWEQATDVAGEPFSVFFQYILGTTFSGQTMDVVGSTSEQSTVEAFSGPGSVIYNGYFEVQHPGTTFADGLFGATLEFSSSSESTTIQASYLVGDRELSARVAGVDDMEVKLDYFLVSTGQQVDAAILQPIYNRLVERLDDLENECLEAVNSSSDCNC